MAEAFTQVSSFMQDELVAGNKLVKVRVIAFRTIPSDIYAVRRIPVAPDDLLTVQSSIAFTAAIIESLALEPFVVGMNYIQDVDRTGQLQDFMEVTVQSQSGNSTAEVLWNLSNLNLPQVSGPIARAALELDAIEAL